MNPKGIVILGAGLLQRPLMEAARKRGWFVISADMNEKAPGVALADVFLQVSTRDAAGLVHALESYRGKFHHSATLGTDMTVSVAAINHAFGLGGLTNRQAEVTTHKGKMRQFLAANGLRQPAFIITDSKDAALQWALERDLKQGFVIKPVHNMGARGVMKLHNPRDLGFAFEYAWSQSFGKSTGKLPRQRNANEGQVILEEYIEAHELSVDALAVNGETFITGLADRCIEIRDGRYFIETGHTMPTQKNREVHEKLLAELRKISKALGELENSTYTGALKGDIRLTPAGEIIVGEVATRLSGGFMSTHTYPFASGNDLLDAYLDVLENKTPAMCSNATGDVYKQVAIERALLADPGRVETFQTPQNFTFPGAVVKEVFTHVSVGDYIGSLQCNIGKPGNVIITAPSLEVAERCADEYQRQTVLKINRQPLTRREINERARVNFNKEYCHACKICDGVNCASGVPGMGGIGRMQAFQDNLRALAEIRVQYPEDTPGDPPGVVDTRAGFLGVELPFPILNAPITGSITNLGSSITEYDYAVEVAMGMKELGLPAIFGDGASPDKYLTALEAVAQSKGGFLVVKPRRDNLEIVRRIEEARIAGANGWGIDIDSVKLVTMQNKNQPMEAKSAKDILEISKKCNLPFFVKGVMMVEQALEMAESGAGVLVVSNHGGRIDDSLPGAARVLEAISREVKKRHPHIKVFADGGVRSGEDVFKMMSLGADGVFIGRPIAIAAVAASRLGVYSVLKTCADELQTVMKKCGLNSISEIASFGKT